MNLRIDAKLLLADVILVVGFFDVVDAFAAADVVLVCVQLWTFMLVQLSQQLFVKEII